MKYSMGFSDTKPKNKIKSRPHKTFEVNSSGLIKDNPHRNIKKYSPFKKIGDRNLKKSPNGPATGAKKKKNIKRVIGKVFTAFVGIGFFLTIAGAIIMGIWLKDIEQGLPEPGKLVDRSQDQSTIIYDRNGRELYKIFADENRTYMSLTGLSPEARKNVTVAVLASEDWGFYDHKGLDITGIAYCSVVSLQNYVSDSGSIEGCGASTISQQLVRNTLMKDVFGEDAYDRSTLFNAAKRKIREWLLTMQVEQTMTKDQILEMYLNEIWMGSSNYGLEAGAKSLYGKNVSELNLTEMTMLAGIITNPGIYNPVYGAEPESSQDRFDYVVSQMKEHKDSINTTLGSLGLAELTDEEISAATTTSLVYNPGKIDILAPHFVFYVRSILDEQFGEDVVQRGGLKVTTSLDYEMQQIGEEEVRNYTSAYGYPFDSANGALVALDPNNGQVLTMVGSIDYWNTGDPRVDGNVNITTSGRQMGSSAKMITYLTAFTQGYSPGLEAADAADFYFGYDAKNWDQVNYGYMTVREGLVKSRNISALYVMQLVGIPAWMDTAQKLGITTLTNPDDYGLSLTLGAADMKLIELTNAYAVLADEGVKHPISPILKVEDSQGNVLYEWENVSERVFDEKEVYLMNWILCDEGGFGDQLMNWIYVRNGSRFVCAKGGTTDGPTDLTGFTYHKNLVVGAWNGNNNNVPIPGVFSTTLTLPMQLAFVQRVEGKYPVEMFSRPAGIAATTICNDTGHIPTAETSCPKTSSIYIVGRAPATDTRQRVKVCKSNGLVPTNMTQAEKFGLVETKDLLNYTTENTLQADNFNKFITTKYGGYLTKMPDSGECPLPLGPNDAPIVSFSEPLDGVEVDAGDSITIAADARALENVEYVKFKFDGMDIAGGTVYTDPYAIVYTIPNSASEGIHIISATVRDNKGKIGTDEITIIVHAAIPLVQIQITSPVNGATISTPLNIYANVNGGTVSSMTFYITNVVTSDMTTLTDSNGGNGWSVTWTGPSGSISTDTKFTIVAQGGGVTSNLITVTVPGL